MNSKKRENLSENEHIRLQVYLARAGLSSRRSAVELLSMGRVRVNGKVVKEAGYHVKGSDTVEVDGKKTSITQNLVYYIFHKPSKTLCSTKDDEHRDLVFSLIQPFVKERIFPVGRLDYMTSGLLLFTNDGEWARLLAHPSTEMEKEYLVETKKEIPEELLQAFQEGLWIDKERFRCHSYRLENPHAVKLILTEGKNREIRKVFQSRSITVKRVHRLRVGSLVLKGLEPGHFRKLTPAEYRILSREAGLGRSN